MVLKEPKAYQEHAKFLHKAGGLLDLLEWNTERQAAERETSFRVEKNHRTDRQPIRRVQRKWT